MQLLCLNYQKHSLLVQQNHVQFYDTIFLPGVVLGNVCVRKTLQAANTEICLNFESFQESLDHFCGIHTRNITMIHSAYLWLQQ